MDWKVSLDRYLTTEPQDDFTPFCEQVYELIPEHIYMEMDKTRFTDSDIENAFLFNLIFIAPEIAVNYLISFFYLMKKKKLILNKTFWRKGKMYFKKNSAQIHKRAEHIAKFYANNLYLLKSK